MPAPSAQVMRRQYRRTYRKWGVSEDEFVRPWLQHIKLDVMHSLIRWAARELFNN